MSEIDVSKCDYCNKNGKCKIPHFKNNIKFTSCNCEDWNCYFKQLQQLKAENEELRQVRKCTPDIQQPYVILYRQLKQQLHNTENELEHIKEEDSRLHSRLYTTLIKNDELKTAYKQNLKLCEWQEQHISKLAASLEKIEKIASPHCSQCNEILEIIKELEGLK